ncbi:hypothetical protein [Amycolatopsis sp. A1MSW2902]|uniref:hypothetical protein n=1 Tax=Amycolatopsis sp. A1MSW2902 TaxID=687413 RepID=UPI00307CE6A9
MGTQFEGELRQSISAAQDASLAALDAGHPYEAYLHRVRLTELLDLAERHGLGAGALVEPAVRAALAEDRAALG